MVYQALPLDRLGRMISSYPVEAVQEPLNGSQRPCEASMGRKVMTFCDVKQPGIYRCFTCDNHLRLEVGEEAPPCIHCNGAPVTWEFVRPLVGPIGFIS